MGPASQTLINDAVASFGTSYPATRDSREQVLDQLDDEDPSVLERLDGRLYELEQRVPADPLIDDFVWNHGDAFYN